MKVPKIEEDLRIKFLATKYVRPDQLQFRDGTDQCGFIFLKLLLPKEYLCKMCLKKLFGVILVLTMMTCIQCSRYALSDLPKTTSRDKSSDQARMFGSIVGIIVQNIDWLPIEVNVIDIISNAIEFFSTLFESTTSTITSMTD